MKTPLGVLIAVVAALSLAAATQAAPRPERALVSSPGAQVAFERALGYFAPAEARPSFRRAAKADPRGATMALRDLAAVFDRLSGRDRRLAADILARPTDLGSGNYTAPKANFRRTCTTRFCIHWVTSTRDAPISGWIRKVKSAMNTVWNTEITTLGYKKPKADRPTGGHRGGNPNTKLDIFIQDVGRFGIYGYCTTDDPKRSQRRDVSAYCVLDDDYRVGQFPSTHGVAALKVTAAHEFHHASQFAYDWKEDRALLEGTATNMEADVYPSIHDNFQFFSASPLRSENDNNDGPWWPIDMFDAEFGNQYGSWIFYRFLEEYFGTVSSRDFAILLEIWEGAAAVPGTNNGGDYSTEAIVGAIADRGANFRDLFAQFGWVNAVPSEFYEDGDLYPAAGSIDRGFFGPGETDGEAWPMFHFSNDYIFFRPFTGATDIDFQLDFPAIANGSNATILRLNSNSTVNVTSAGLDVNGNATINNVPFSPASVTGVILVLTNDSVAMTNCGSDPLGAPVQFACRGDALHDTNNGFNWSVNVD